MTNELQGNPSAHQVLALFAIKQDPSVERTIPELEAMARTAATAIEAAQAKVGVCEEQTAEYQRLGRELNAQIVSQNTELTEFRTASIRERIANFGACDVTGLSQQLRARSDAHAFNVSAYTFLMESALQDAQEATLVAIWQAARLQTAQANVVAVLSEARTNLALGPVFEQEGSVAFVGGRSTSLHLYADSMLKAEESAKKNLEDFQLRRSKLEATRGLTGGPVTSQQVRHAI